MPTDKMFNGTTSIKIFAPRRKARKEKVSHISLNLASFAPLREISFSEVLNPKFQRSYSFCLPNRGYNKLWINNQDS